MGRPCPPYRFGSWSLFHVFWGTFRPTRTWARALQPGWIQSWPCNVLSRVRSLSTSRRSCSWGESRASDIRVSTAKHCPLSLFFIAFPSQSQVCISPSSSPEDPFPTQSVMNRGDLSVHIKHKSWTPFLLWIWLCSRKQWAGSQQTTPKMMSRPHKFISSTRNHETYGQQLMWSQIN
jgi:hypothetical protein